MQPQSHPEHLPVTALFIEAWIHPLSALTPSLIVHNLELQGMQLPQLLTIAIDRGHYDCTGTNYAVISVRTQVPIAFTNPTPDTQPQSSFYCSFFSQKAAQGMEPNAWYPHWLGNCYVHMGETAALCSCRHESGHAKTWRKPQVQDCDREDAVSVEPFPSANPSPKCAKKDLRIIQLQKKNLVLRTELDVLRCELRALKTDVGCLVQQHKEQEAATKRANQCMQDWANKQVIERVWILETQHAQLRSEHLKQKEQQQQQQQQQCKKVKLSKKSKKELKKLSKRLELLENTNKRTDYECNKCNSETISCNPFDFKAIYEHYDRHHYLNADADTDVGINACPALDLIANHYADVPSVSVPSVSVPSVSVPSEPVPSAIESLNPDECTDDDDDDLFQLIQIEVVSDFSLPK